MKTMSPVHRAEVKLAGAAPHTRVRVHFCDAEALKRFAASIVEMASSSGFDHMHLQDVTVSREHPGQGLEIVFLRDKKAWEED